MLWMKSAHTLTNNNLNKCVCVCVCVLHQSYIYKSDLTQLVNTEHSHCLWERGQSTCMSVHSHSSRTLGVVVLLMLYDRT